MITTSLALLPLVFSPVQKADKAEQLKEASRLLHGTTEEAVRSGAKICLALNCIESMELLLSVLKATQPHFRDIVWEVMPDFKDPYARRVIEAELERNEKDPELRAWCADLLGRFGDGVFAKTLEKSLREKSEEVRKMSARSLGRLKQNSSIKPLLNYVRDKDPFVRANAVEALARIDASGYRGEFMGALKDTDGGVRCALLAVVPELYAAANEELSTLALEDSDWRPRMQAVENLIAIKTKGAMDALVRASGDGRPVVQQKAIQALSDFTGKKWASRDLWEAWWKDNREKFEFPDGKAKVADAGGPRTVVTYNGLHVSSDHIIFLIDRSMEMTGKLGDGRGKFEAALSELDEALKKLQGRLTFNIFTYAEDLDAYAKKPVILDEKTRKSATAFVAKMTKSGNKDIWNALSTTMSDPSIDTIYLLSSGEPQVGLYVHWNRVTEHLKDLNRFHKIVIHTIAYNDSKWYRDQLEQIANSTGGKFIFFE